MKYRVLLRVKMQNDSWVAIGEEHTILWDTRDLITASSGWTVLNQEDAGSAGAFIPLLEKGIIELTQHELCYHNYEISHGLGTINDILKFYRNLLKACKEHPFTEVYGCIVA